MNCSLAKPELPANLSKHARGTYFTLQKLQASYNCKAAIQHMLIDMLAYLHFAIAHGLYLRFSYIKAKITFVKNISGSGQSHNLQISHEETAQFKDTKHISVITLKIQQNCSTV